MKVEVKVGFFVLAAMLVLMGGAAYVGNFSVGGSGYEFTVQYGQSGGLRQRSKLKFGAGEDVGYVTKINYDRESQMTQVHVKVYEGITIYKDSKFSITSSNLLGDKFINVSGGTAVSGTINAGDLVSGNESGGMDGAMAAATEVMGELQKTLSTLNSVVGTRETKAALQNAVSGLSKTVTATQPKIVNILDNLEDMTESMKKATQSLSELAATMNTLAGPKNQVAFTKTLHNFEEATAKLNSTLENVDSITKKIDTGQGAVGVLMSDKKVADDVKEMMKKLKDDPSILLWGPKKK